MTKEEIKFEGGYSDLFRQNGFLIFEADNHSDGYLMEQGKVLIEQSNTLLLHIEGSAKEDLGNLKLLFEQLRKHKIEFLYQIEGRHKKLEQMLNFLKTGRKVELGSYFKSN